MSNTELPRIQRLSSTLANQIAAGEVIERPASVLKELLENAIDAGATRINIDLQRAGVAKIKVTDNGIGIHEDDLSLALERHSTSKIETSSDLESIHSLGFRGEALASIASVSRFTLSSCRDDNKQGLCLKRSADEKAEIMPIAHNQGTTVEVCDLFYNTPARRKFLRSENTEYLHSLSLVKAMALAKFDCAFNMQHNQRSVLSLTQSGEDYSRRVADILGRQFMQNSLAFDFSHEQLSIWGWLGKPEISRSQSDKQFLYLNGRIIKDKHINHAIRLAFQDQLYQGRFPSYVLFLEMDPALVDVNVHPTKQEVRFRHNRDVHDFIYTCLLKLLSPDVSLSFNDRDVLIGDVDKEKQQWQVNEDSTAYQPTKGRLGTVSPEKKSNIYINKRYALIEIEQGSLLLDTEAVRVDRMIYKLTQQVDKGKVISKPMLMPMEIEARDTQLSDLESSESILNRLGINFKRIAPDRLLIKSLPAACPYVDVESFFSDLISIYSKEKALTTKMLIDLFSQHANDHLPNELSKEEQQALLDFCLQQNISGTQQRKRGHWRIFNEQDLEKLLLS